MLGVDRLQEQIWLREDKGQQGRRSCASNVMDINVRRDPGRYAGTSSLRQPMLRATGPSFLGDAQRQYARYEDEGARPRWEKKSAGFLSLGISGYAILGLAAALAVSVGVASCESKAKVRAQENAARIQGEFDGFVAQTKRLGDQALAEKAAIEAKWKEVLTNAAKRYSDDLAGRDAAIARLRSRPPARPDGGSVSVVACRPESPDAAGRELVPLAEYRELEARAYDDALRLTRLQEWIRSAGIPVQ